MKKLFLLAWPIALAAVSCSNEEVVSVNNDANEIKFTAVAENATRAADSYCNNDMPADFNVWARVDGKQYFANVLYSQVGDTKTYKAEGGEVHFWPVKDIAVSFWAAKNHGEGFKWNQDQTDKTPTIDFAPAELAENQLDLLYAYTVKPRPAYGDNANGTVEMNFRHALSQVVFKAKVTNPTIKVEIDQVKVCRIKSQGTFTYPSTITDGKLGVHNGASEDETTAGGIGVWNTQTKATSPAIGTFDTGKITPAVTIIANNETKNLTEETASHDAETRDIKHTLLLLPQETAKWEHTAGTTGTGVEGATGAYFLVYCKIWNVSGLADGSNLLLWGNTVPGEGESVTYTTKAVAIPVDINWLPGRKYIYTFNFGTTTTGGFDPTTGEDVLIPISFNVTVDDFVNVENHEIGMN